MILGILVVLLSVVIVAITINAVEEYRKKSDSKISFKESMDLTELPIVTFYNGNTKLNFLLDTGSNESHVNSAILSLLDYTKTHQKSNTIGMEGNRVYNETCKMVVYYKKHKFEEYFNITDLNTAFEIVKQESGVQIHGILGSKFFEKYKYVLDFNELIAYMK